jgi:hypothetical protein
LSSQLCYYTPLAHVGGAIYCTRQVWICLIISHHNTVNSMPPMLPRLLPMPPRRLPMPPRRLLSSRTLGLMGKPPSRQQVFLHCLGLRHFEQPSDCTPLALVGGAIYCLSSQLCYYTPLAHVGGAIYCTRQVWICLIISHHNTVNSSNDQYSNNTVINTQKRIINTIVDHH